MSVNLIAVFLHIILTTVYYNQDMIVSAAVAAVVLEFVHTVVKFTDIFQFTILGLCTTMRSSWHR